LYKSRWRVELFFKWIKQHLRIKTFYGVSENAVKSQIWIGVRGDEKRDFADRVTEVVLLWELGKNQVNIV
jgi:hypothetical protein